MVVNRKSTILLYTATGMNDNIHTHNATHKAVNTIAGINM